MEVISHSIKHHKKPLLVSIQSYQLITKKEAASLLSISTRTLDRMISCGDLPQPIKVGGSSRLLLSEITEFINQASKKAIK